MEEQDHIPLSFKEIMALQRSGGLTEYEAWRQAVVYYNQQRGGQADATTSDEIPLGESILTSKTAPASGTPAVRYLFYLISPQSFTDSGTLDPPQPPARERGWGKPHPNCMQATRPYRPRTG